MRLRRVQHLGRVAEAEREIEAHGLRAQDEVGLRQIDGELVVTLARGAYPGKEVRMIGGPIEVVVEQGVHGTVKLQTRGRGRLGLFRLGGLGLGPGRLFLGPRGGRGHQDAEGEVEH